MGMVSSAFGLADAGGAVADNPGRRVVYGEYLDAATGLLAIPNHVFRVPAVLGCKDVETQYRVGSSQQLKFLVDVTAKTVRDALTKKGVFDSLENILRMCEARMRLAYAEGQDHRNSLEAHRSYVQALQDAFGDLSTELVEVEDTKAKRRVYRAIVESMDKLEEQRFLRKLPWDTAGGMLIQPKFVAMCAHVQAVKESVLAAGNGGVATDVFGLLRVAGVLDSDSKPNGPWVRDRALGKGYNKPPRSQGDKRKRGEGDKDGKQVDGGASRADRA